MDTVLESKCLAFEDITLRDELSWRDVDGELVVLDLDSGNYFTFNNTGRLIWLAIAEDKPLSELVASIREHHDVTDDEQIMKDVQSFIGQLAVANFFQKPRTAEE